MKRTIKTMAAAAMLSVVIAAGCANAPDSDRVVRMVEEKPANRGPVHIGMSMGHLLVNAGGPDMTRELSYGREAGPVGKTSALVYCQRGIIVLVRDDKVIAVGDGR